MLYTPNTNFNGPDAFTFTVSDGSLSSAPATIAITVNPVNDAPVADPQSVTTPEDASIGITLSGGDVDGDALAYSILSPPGYGALSGTPPNLTYTPNPNYNGPDSFTFRAFDGSLYSGPAAVSITVTPVNDPPAAAAGGPYTVSEGASVTVSGLGSDVDGDALAFAWDLDNNGSPETPGAAATFSAAGLDGPAARTIALRVADPGGLWAMALATVNIQNAPPVVGAIGTPIDPVPMNSSINASAAFSDAGVLDTHTAVWNWGDAIGGRR